MTEQNEMPDVIYAHPYDPDSNLIYELIPYKSTKPYIAKEIIGAGIDVEDIAMSTELLKDFISDRNAHGGVTIDEAIKTVVKAAERLAKLIEMGE